MGKLRLLLKNLDKEQYVFLLFAIAIFLIYLKSVFFKFTYLDDSQLLLQRGQFLNNFANIYKSFQEPVFYLSVKGSTYYRPILNVFFILEYKLFGETFYPYHVFNIVIHLINTFLVYKLLLKLKIKNNVSIISALIFGVHPVLTQAVAWIPGVNDLLVGLFFLPSLLYLINFLEGNSLKDLFFYILFFALSLFTKESAILLIFVYAAMFFLIRNKKSVKKFILVTIPPLILIVVFLYLRFKAVGVEVPKDYVLKSVGNDFAGGFLFNLGKIFFPVNLSVIPILYQNNFFLGISSLFILIATILFSLKKNIKLIIIGAAIFILSFIPTLVNPTPGEKFVMFEQRLYIPLVGILVILAASSIYTRYFIGKKVYIVVLVIFSLLAFVHLDSFRDQYAFWENAKNIANVFPAVKANLAYVYFREGKVDNAKKLLRDLIGTKYEDYAYANLGIIETHEGNFDTAMEDFKKSLKFNPLNSNSYLFMGYIYKYKNDIPNAKNYFLYAIYSDNDNVEAMMNLAAIYVDEGNMERAQAIYDEVKKHGISY